MISNSHEGLKKYFVEGICLLYILLFVYAAVSKILDFENFQVQLGQSPLLSAFALWVSWLVIIMELLIAFLLARKKNRKLGLLAALGLMMMFSAYIYVILNFSSFIPCSCGGILEKMSWNVHLAFNIVFVILAILALAVLGHERNNYAKGILRSRAVKWTTGIMFSSVMTVVALFLASEQIMHKRNPFIRRYPQHPAEFANTMDIKHNSYYFAGFANNRIYLGNYEYPTYVLSMDQNLKHKKLEKIRFDFRKIPYRMITISVQDPYFFLSDGTVPNIMRGDIKDWTVNKKFEGVPYFTRAVSINGNTIALRSNSKRKLANVIGVYRSDSEPKIKFNKELLHGEDDGVFNTDGTLLYSSGAEKIVYLYYYRNEFTVIDPHGNLIGRSHTIDTITHPQIKVAFLDNGKQLAMSSPALVVNANAAVYKNLLFVHSTVKGRYENDRLWKKSFIIDIYDLNKNSYVFSFPIYHTASNVLNALTVTGTHLYAIIGTDLVVYEYREILKKEIK